MAKKFLSGIDLAAQRAQNAAPPVAATDLATKGYVDGAAGTATLFVQEDRPLLISDDFTRADAATMGAASDGQSWETPNNDWGINTNRAGRHSGGITHNQTVLDAGDPDAYVEAVVAAGRGGAYVGVIGRWANALNYFLFQGGIAVAGTCQVYVYVAGNFGLVATLNHTVAVGDKLAMRMKGDLLTPYVNDVAFASYAMSGNHATATKFGLNSYDSGWEYFDDVVLIPEPRPYFWVETGLGDDGADMTFWVEDGS